MQNVIIAFLTRSLARKQIVLLATEEGALGSTGRHALLSATLVILNHKSQPLSYETRARMEANVQVALSIIVRSEKSNRFDPETAIHLRETHLESWAA